MLTKIYFLWGFQSVVQAINMIKSTKYPPAYIDKKNQLGIQNIQQSESSHLACS